MKRLVYIGLTLLILMGCQSRNQPSLHHKAKGKLFIIGGGKRGEVLMQRLHSEANLQANEFGIILPMASEEPDSSAFYALKSLTSNGFTPNQVVAMYLSADQEPTQAQLDSLMAAKLIYIPGGDQNKFMKSIQNAPVTAVLKANYENGGMIAGTSAGAAVMSEKMITGNELRYTDYNNTFRNIESNNIELAEGLGFISNAIIDQHFIKRSRHNRLLSAVIENPDLLCIGIDESTALLVQGRKAQVVGESQVLVYSNPTKSQAVYQQKLGAKEVLISIYLPGETFEF